MNIKVNICLSGSVPAESAAAIERGNNAILEAALEAVGRAILALDERRLKDLLAFCQTGRYPD